MTWGHSLGQSVICLLKVFNEFKSIDLELKTIILVKSLWKTLK